MSGLWKQVADWPNTKVVPLVADWTLVRSPWMIFTIMALYVVGTLSSIRYMRNRPPYDLRNVMLAYNLFQVLFSGYLFKEFLVSSILMGYDLRCQPPNYAVDLDAQRMADVSWWFLFSKLVDVIDTVFFILRKKNDHVTFLHLYHHTTMIFNAWIGVRYAAGGQSFFCAVFNSFVHMIMYTYYFLSAFGPQMQKYLFWKRYLTQLQLVQFVMVIAHLVYGAYNNCNFPHLLTYFPMLYCSTLIVLFSNFYLKAYRDRRSARDKRNQQLKSKTTLNNNNGHIPSLSQKND